ncbi:LysR family transcriptional regulator [Aquamicrobium sp. LC103]|uniref:LysR family transcriptional regulator n=1 Tax=Aquamicrobium sp. LC103 TaxID=1120658 RepID=UPI00063E96D7|nr:LysR family transcriptional regulator [Aquamicrobium sp. LC103]TKT69268.1 LysR family transcriptional regulator [Aquamicrobium sp. LC103]
MIPFNIKQLETFLWVAALGSFRKAAIKLNTTQPAISTRIAGLEKALSARLFERLNNNVKLTAKGQQVLPLVQRTLRAAERLQMTASSTATVEGVLRVGVADTIVHTWLSDFLRRFRDDYPLVDVDLTVDISLRLQNELTARHLDMAILMGPVAEHRIENIGIPPFPLTWVCSPKLDFPEGNQIPLAELLRHPIITYARATRPFSELHRKFSSEFDETPRLFPAGSLAASLRMVLDGLGIGALPHDVVCDHVAAGRLRTIDCEWQPSALRFTASFPVDPPNPVAQQAAQLAANVAEAYASARGSPRGASS